AEPPFVVAFPITESVDPPISISKPTRARAQSRSYPTDPRSKLPRPTTLPGDVRAAILETVDAFECADQAEPLGDRNLGVKAVARFSDAVTEPVERCRERLTV